MVSRRKEALQRFLTVLVVNKNRIPPEVITALMKSWEEYMAAFGEEITETLESLVDKLEDARAKQEEPEL